MYVGCRHTADDKKKKEAGKVRKGSGWTDAVIISLPNIHIQTLPRGTVSAVLFFRAQPSYCSLVTSWFVLFFRKSQFEQIGWLGSPLLGYIIFTCNLLCLMSTSWWFFFLGLLLNSEDEVTCTSETFVHHTIRHYIAEDKILYSHCCETLSWINHV